MKMVLICNNPELCAGLRLAGIDSICAHSDEEFDHALENAVTDPDTAIIIVPKSKLIKRNTPLILELEI